MPMTTWEQAKKTTVQHKKPCKDCPLRRCSIPGWLGGSKPQDWVAGMHGEEKVRCHTKRGPQCAGAAIYRKNVCKRPRDSSVLLLPADRETVFANAKEFLEHHTL